MDKVFFKGELLAIRIKKISKGTLPISDPKEPLQLLAAGYPKNHVVRPHFHKPFKRTTGRLQECLVVVKGKIKADIYGPDKNLVKSIDLKAGEAIILFKGGHSIKALEKAEIFEIKNGPFIDDKVFLK